MSRLKDLFRFSVDFYIFFNRDAVDSLLCPSPKVLASESDCFFVYFTGFIDLTYLVYLTILLKLD